MQLFVGTENAKQQQTSQINNQITQASCLPFTQETCIYPGGDRSP